MAEFQRFRKYKKYNCLWHESCLIYKQLRFCEKSEGIGFEEKTEIKF